MGIIDGNIWGGFCLASSRCQYFTYFLSFCDFPNKGGNNRDSKKTNKKTPNVPTKTYINNI